jgi:hypothetical protein
MQKHVQFFAYIMALRCPLLSSIILSNRLVILTYLPNSTHRNGLRMATILITVMMVVLVVMLVSALVVVLVVVVAQVVMVIIVVVASGLVVVA